MKKKVGVVFGGCSVEHDISVISTYLAIESLDDKKYDYILIYLDKGNNFYVGSRYDNIEAFIKKTGSRTLVTFTKVGTNKVQIQPVRGYLKKKYRVVLDCILPIVHGAGIEDGTLAGYFNILGVPYCSSNVLSASVAQDKVIMKRLVESLGVNVVPYYYIDNNEWIENRVFYLNKVSDFGYPVIIKPVTLGSSIGISIADNDNELIDSINLAFKYDNRVLIEKALTNFIELNCAVLKTKKGYISSSIEEVITDNKVYSFADKYYRKQKNVGTDTKRIIPANIDINLAAEIAEKTIEIASFIDNKGVSRIDYLYCLETKTLYFNEFNSIPGSLSFYLFEEKGIFFSQLLDELIYGGIWDKYSNLNKINVFESDVLNIKNVKINKFK